MTTLTRASNQLFRRPDDERFETLGELAVHCQNLKDKSRRLKEPGTEFRPDLHDGRLAVRVNGHPAYPLNDWSFSQLCSIAAVAKDTINRLQPATAVQVLAETLPYRVSDETELQALVFDDRFIRSINGEQYKRLWNADLVAMLQEFATDFQPPQKGFNGATGLYAGDQDMFCFMIDPNGWTEIQGEAFAPGFFVWNSEVGKRTVGISTFWFQAVCANHIVWDATDILEFTRKHTGNVRDSFAEIRTRIEALVNQRDQRKDGFARVIAKAMQTSYGQDAEEVQKLLSKAGFAQALAKKATELARQKGRFSLWNVVDALTQLARSQQFAGSRTDADQKASALLALASS